MFPPRYFAPRYFAPPYFPPAAAAAAAVAAAAAGQIAEPVVRSAYFCDGDGVLRTRTLDQQDTATRAHAYAGQAFVGADGVLRTRYADADGGVYVASGYVDEEAVVRARRQKGRVFARWVKVIFPDVTVANREVGDSLTELVYKARMNALYGLTSFAPGFSGVFTLQCLPEYGYRSVNFWIRGGYVDVQFGRAYIHEGTIRFRFPQATNSSPKPNPFGSHSGWDKWRAGITMGGSPYPNWSVRFEETYPTSGLMVSGGFLLPPDGLLVHNVHSDDDEHAIRILPAPQRQSPDAATGPSGLISDVWNMPFWSVGPVTWDEAFSFSIDML